MSVFAAIAGLGMWELLVILLLVLVVFGAGRLPQVFESMGKGLKSFRDAQKDDAVDVSPPKSLSETTKVSDAEEVRHKTR
jgi:sec-independent protein translocase protein TatA